MVRAFHRFCHFTSVPLPHSLSLSFSPANAPHPTLSLYTALSYLFARIFFLRVARFYYFSFLQFLFYFFFCFFFRFGLVLLPNTLRKAFHVCCAYEFQIFKNVSIVSPAFVVQVHVCVSVCPPALVCVCVCVWAGRRQALAKAGDERRNANCEKNAMCAAPLPLTPLPVFVATHVDRNDF